MHRMPTATPLETLELLVHGLKKSLSTLCALVDRRFVLAQSDNSLVQMCLRLINLYRSSKSRSSPVHYLIPHQKLHFWISAGPRSLTSKTTTNLSMRAMVTKSTMSNVLTLYLYADVALQYPYLIFIIGQLLNLLPYTGSMSTCLEFVAFDPLCLLMPACSIETSYDVLNLTFSPSCSSQRSVALEYMRILGFSLALITSIMYRRETAVRKAKKRFPGPGRKGELRINIPPKSPFIREAQFLNEMAKQEMIELDALFESYVGLPVKVSLPSASLSEVSKLLSPTSTADQNTIDWLQQSPDNDRADDAFRCEWSGHLKAAEGDADEDGADPRSISWRPAAPESCADEDGTDFRSRWSGHLAAPESVVDADADDTDIWWQLFFEEHGSFRLCSSPASYHSSGSGCPSAAGQILESNVGKGCESDFDLAELSSSIDRKVTEWMGKNSEDEGLFWDEM